MDLRIALAGNPNSGKTTLFNALTGSNQFVGNWPGVTVEKKEGKLKKQDGVIITDLPGIYSLSPYSLEEVVARNYLVGERPDAIINLVDGTNLERNLYLTTQLIELGIPVVIAINMMDIVRKNGDMIHIEALSKILGCEVVEISALKGTGITEAAEKAIEAAKNKKYNIPRHIFSGAAEHAIAHIEEAVVHELPAEQQRWYAIKIFERDEKVLELMKLPEDLRTHIEEDIVAAEKELDDEADSIIINDRYNYITSIIGRCYKKKNKGGLTTSDKIDKVLTNRWLALPIFAAIMFGIYYISVTTVGTWVTDWTNDVLFGEIIPPAVENFLTSVNCAPWLQSLIIDGIISGVGAVLGFVPQMLVLFLFLAFLEACGYMSRIAFLMDKVFRKFGLSGKSFIPILVGTGCGVPGIMASRTIENEHDRRMTIITTTFIPCGAKLPIVGLIAGALFDNAWWVAASAYFIGIAAIILSGIILKKTKMFTGDPAPFVMELPAYHMPTPKSVLSSMWERGWSFIKKAGTVILLSSVILWFLQGFGVVDGKFVMVGEEELDHSILAIIGSAISWMFAPLGFGGWQYAVAVVTGLIAKENVVATFSVLFGIDSTGELTALAGYSFLVFNLLCAPCFAAIGAIRREMNSAKWTWFAIGYQTAFAYIVSLCIYQIGSAFTGNLNIIGLVVSLIFIALALFLIFRPYKEATKLTGKI
ncbi:MAG: ferrous iron transport protein B [Ruminococcaceae bacterium]|nr:ferrous iron transport protein B [Oscillospiraceae bacterium]